MYSFILIYFYPIKYFFVDTLLYFFAIFGMVKNAKYAILSFSGGLDSTSLLINLLYNKFNIQCITFDYGQNHLIEIEKAKLNIQYLNDNGFNNRIEHRVVNIKDAFNSKGSSLFKNSEDIPRGHYEDSNMLSTFVPNRNAIFTSIIFSYALSWSKELNNKNIYFSLGCHSGDHAIYPDCRPEFYKKLIESLKVGNWGGDNIDEYMPYINYTKTDILKEALPFIEELGLNYKDIYRNTNTSYSPDKNGVSPGDTGSDIERILAFNAVGLKDPVKYKLGWEAVLENAIKVEEDYQKSAK